MNVHTETLGIDIEQPIYAGKVESEENPRENPIPLDLLRLVESEEKQMLPHEESNKTINLETEKHPKEVKIETSIKPSTRAKLISLL